MNQHLQTILSLLQDNKDLPEEEKIRIATSLKAADRELEITAFKLDRTEKVKRTTGILLEETIAELEQKRAAVEAQNLELEIESSLERVRTVAMGMKQPGDMLDVCRMISGQLQQLGFQDIRNVQTVIIHEPKHEYLNYQYFAPYDKNSIELIDYRLHPDVLAFTEKMLESEDAYYTKTFEGAALDTWRQYRKQTNQLPDPKLDETPSAHYYFYSIGSGALGITTYAPLQEEQINLFKRFRNVFQLAYSRFLDIEKAEAQSRESQIQLALERVRARTMAMQHSEELAETATVLFEQFHALGEVPERIAIAIVHEEEQVFDIWATQHGGNQMQLLLQFSVDEPHVMRKMYAAWREQKTSITIDLQGNELEEYFQFLKQSGAPVQREIFGDRRVENVAFFSQGALMLITPGPIPAESIRVLERFAGVFNLTYTRFSDLQKAEAQAREARIEAALEKVRGKAMAMHNSNDLSVTASMVFTELRKLDINPIRCGVGLLNNYSRKAQLYSATSSGNNDSLALVGWVELSGHPVLEQIYASWQNNEDYYPELTGAQLQSYYELLLKGLPVTVPDSKDGQTQYGHFLPFTVGCLYAWSTKPYAASEINILKRFALIIDLTFRRYLELQQSEANAKEAVKQAALDRIRADIASMRTIADLDRITPLIWNELTNIGVPFIRCGVFIMDEATEKIHTFLSTPDGKAIAAFHLPYHLQGTTTEVLKHWRKKEVYKEHWDAAAFSTWTRTLVEQGIIASQEQYLTEHPPADLNLYFLPFLQGMLYVGSESPLSDEAIQLVQTLADAFSTAYARYEDFNKLESAKQQIEKTLVDLKQAQTQLIQSEKMASLGELTAGIAHEIQNPLNFVNNFSEVNTELIHELKTELAAGNTKDALTIADDIAGNEQKINHHGKRADAIVKGMLQHSRSSSGQKEPTDINALAEEYLRLSYHGMRSKDKVFNAEYKTCFDETVGKVNVVPQDIGRVLLNLFNNAFYAVYDKKKQQPAGYRPGVIVNTENLGDRIRIRVQDNGNGIPKNLMDKIFQPFFTTKPTGVGTGLGLSLSYDIIKAHGGELKVETREGEGTGFIIELPVGGD